LDVTQEFGGEHNGIDFSVTEGRAVFSVYTGTVEAAGYTTVRGYYIEVDHGEVFGTGADYLSRYDHLSAINVSVGNTVTGGCQIGWSGDTGESTGPHLLSRLMLEAPAPAIAILPPEAVDPVAWWNVPAYFLEARDPPPSPFMHMYQSIWTKRGVDAEAPFPAGSLAERLWRAYGL
jgi:murein DD-endopeptidase MepM/ murein hydrolase activator NlpD